MVQSRKVPSLAHLKDKVVRIILLQGTKGIEDTKEKQNAYKLKSILEEVDQVSKAIFMTGLPK